MADYSGAYNSTIHLPNQGDVDRMQKEINSLRKELRELKGYRSWIITMSHEQDYKVEAKTLDEARELVQNGKGSPVKRETTSENTYVGGHEVNE